MLMRQTAQMSKATITFLIESTFASYRALLTTRWRCNRHLMCGTETRKRYGMREHFVAKGNLILGWMLTTIVDGHFNFDKQKTKPDVRTWGTPSYIVRCTIRIQSKEIDVSSKTYVFHSFRSEFTIHSIDSILVNRCISMSRKYDQKRPHASTGGEEEREREKTLTWPHSVTTAKLFYRKWFGSLSIGRFLVIL